MCSSDLSRANRKVNLTAIGCLLCRPIAFNFTSVFGYASNMVDIAEQYVAIDMPGENPSQGCENTLVFPSMKRMGSDKPTAPSLSANYVMSC